jgi:cell division initiation protein
MKITPLDIKQKSFEKKTFGGVDKDEVSAFLSSLASAWEKLLDENRELRIRLESAEKESAKMREVERSLYLTLKNAEETGSSLIEQSNKTAALNLKDSQMKAEAVIREARWQAKTLVETAEDEASKVYQRYQQEIKGLENDYKSIEILRDNLLTELKNLSHDIIEKVERVSRRGPAPNFNNPDFTRNNPRKNKVGTETPLESKPVRKQEPAPLKKPDDDLNPPSGPGKTTGSFFDQI